MSEVELSHPQKSDSNIYWPPTDELDITTRFSTILKNITKLEKNYVQDSERRSDHFSVK